MTSMTRPRGPLPRRVYWVRRLMVLGMATLLVVGVGRILTAGSDGSSPPDRAAHVAASTTPSETGKTTRTKGTDGKKERQKHRDKASETPSSTLPPTPVLAQPTGPCANSDIVATPVVAEAVGGGEVLIVVELTTRETPACTWTVSPETLTLKITSGDDDIWTSRECPRSVPTRNLVVRQATGTRVGVQWSGKRSDSTCSELTAWALPGFYHVVTAALAGEPTDVQFELVKPPRPVVTTTITPSPTEKSKQPKRNH